MEKLNYQSPEVDVIEVVVEQGFTASPGTTVEGFQSGGTW